MLESLEHLENAFVTLTYAEDTLPDHMSLEPATLQRFMKRLRERIAPKRLRFFAVGEYGDKSDRPHYHALLFGFPTCVRGRSCYSKFRTSCCSVCDLVRDVWGLGHVGLGTVTTESVAYTCGYVVKNMRRFDDARLNGKHPEFARMSLKPGIGHSAMWNVADILMKWNKEDDDRGDVPRGLRHGSKVMPYGRYLRRALRQMVGKDAAAPEGSFTDEEVSLLFEAACANTPKGGEIRRTVFKNALIDASAQRVLNMEARAKLWKRRVVI